MQSGDTFPVNSRKQRSAFPPNFVHSLDSTHMMFTARAMYKAGLEFSAVHDSYWTHACDVDRMNIILRKCFIQLHKEPLLENLLAEFRTRHPLLEFPPVPPRGELDLDVIQKSPYFFHWQTKRQPTSSHTYEYLSSKSSKDDECLRVLHWYSHYPLETFA